MYSRDGQGNVSKGSVQNDAVRIRDWLVANKTPDAGKRMLTQFSACCKWAMKSKLIAENPFEGYGSGCESPEGR
ncbi:MAG: hypothetical protein IGS50_10655 [Synechococcales cyanobacterium C42_A2020_086]|jgi:hypothetical protein|nr:hypothetical protein [Synechococcales cyanobacterium C42_A2020_086]